MSLIASVDAPLTRWSKNASNDWFLRLTNLRAAMRRTGGRFSAQGDDFLYREGGRELAFRSRLRGARDYVDGWERRARTMARQYMIDQIAIQPGAAVVDCGANTGDLHLWFALSETNVDYWAIEPSAAEFQCLRRNVPGARAHQCALWRRDETLKFYVNTKTADSSVIEIKTHSEVVEIPARRLDGLLPADLRVRLLKLEAEGAEPEVLEGAEGALDRIDYIAVDSGPERGFAQEETTAACVNFLVRRGFDLLQMRHGRVCLLFKRQGVD